jgi:hypothetical protein
MLEGGENGKDRSLPGGKPTGGILFSTNWNYDENKKKDGTNRGDLKRGVPSGRKKDRADAGIKNINSYLFF